MNLCHFAKVLIARASKDQSSIQYWQDHASGVPLRAEHLIPRYDTSLSENSRYHFYCQVMHKYPKMYISKYQFHNKIGRVQSYLTQSKFFRNSNKSGEKNSYLETYNLMAWLQQSEHDRKSHALSDCPKCLETESGLHSSASADTLAMEDLSFTITKSILEEGLTSPQSSNKKVEKFMNTLSPILKQKLDVNLNECVKKTFNLQSKENSTEKQKQSVKKLKENKTNIQNALFGATHDVERFLSSGTSYNQYERERLEKFFETSESAKELVEKKSKKIKLGLNKPKKHHGKFTSYVFNKQAFLLEMKENKNENVNWSSLARKYTIKTKNGQFPANAGQILKQYAQDNGVDVNRFNRQKTVSGRDIAQRIRRKYLRVRGITVPRERSARLIRQSVNENIEQGVFDVGICIAPKVLQTTKINSSGELVMEEEEIYGRKFSLTSIRERSLQEQAAEGVLRSLSDSEYQDLSDLHFFLIFKLQFPLPCAHSFLSKLFC